MEFHPNGVAKSLIKVVKGIVKSLMRVVGDTKLSLKELNNLLAECANLANERPIGLKPNTQTDSEYLSPNSLQLGRSSLRIIIIFTIITCVVFIFIICQWEASIPKYKLLAEKGTCSV